MEQARRLVKEVDPDLITLDIEMPGTKGLIFLKNLMRLRPTPMLVFSNFAQEGSEGARAAWDLGAAEVMGKPATASLASVAADIRARARAAVGLPALASPRRIVAIAASTGGTEAIRAILQSMPATGPPILIVQHLPEGFVLPFARRLDESSAMRVSLARDGDLPQPGHAYLAPGNRHLRLRGGVCRVEEGELVSGRCPAADCLFASQADVQKERAIGVLLTGMGQDGARGLAQIFQGGGQTLVQDEATSVVWGTPGQSVLRGAAQEILPLQEIAPAILRRASRRI